MTWLYSRWMAARKTRQRLKELRQEYADVGRKLDVLYDDYDGEATPAGSDELGHKLGFIEEKITVELQRRLLRSAEAWRIYVEREKKQDWKRGYYQKASILTKSAEHELRERIFQRQLIFAGITFGFSSIIQAIYAALSFHLHR